MVMFALIILTLVFFVCALNDEYKNSFNGKGRQRVKITYTRSNVPKHEQVARRIPQYVDAMPIYRQEQAWKRLGGELSYSSLSEMQRMGYELIKPHPCGISMGLSGSATQRSVL